MRLMLKNGVCVCVCVCARARECGCCKGMAKAKGRLIPQTRP